MVTEGRSRGCGSDTPVIGSTLSIMGGRMRKAALGMSVCMVFAAAGFLDPAPCSAADAQTSIISQTLQYFSDQKKYVAKGSVRVERGDARADADEMTYFEETGDVHAEGNVRYDDATVSFTAQKAEMNMEKKTGRLYQADVLFKEDNYHISGNMLERISENEFSSKDEARITTCDGIPAAWCFRGRDVYLSAGDKMTAHAATFRVRDVPVLYTPYLMAPALTERQTGFLMPTISNSTSRGFGLNLPFFWAIDENRDATFVLDSYAKRGIGTGVEYRYVEPGGITGNWWAYYIRDRELDKDFVEVKGLHENRTEGGTGWFLNVNYVSEKDYYREFNPHKEKQILRFLESTGEFAIPFEKSRLYFLAQYWVDLKEDTDTGDIPQRLPEVGYVMHYTRIGNFLISAETSAANFWRKDGISAQRLDVYPRVLHTLGTDVVLSQSLAVRGTAYAYSGHERTDDNLERTAVEYDADIHTRLMKRYGTVTHVVEPMVRYRYIDSSENDLVVFDSAEYYKRTALLELSVLNRILVKGREIAAVRITQPVDTNNGDRPFLPLVFELGTRRPLPIRLTTTYDVNRGEIKTVSSEVIVPFKNGSFNFGQRYNRERDIMVFKAGFIVKPVRSIELIMNAWYDAKGEGLTNLRTAIKYSSQCWGVRFEAAKRPKDFTMRVMFDLYGITGKAPAYDKTDKTDKTMQEIIQEI
ncbi:MAG TPA: LPS assembly protein LptD [Thermodesulfovibrionales bacterium]|nr:LPS assembly protein LptD [Thermodesulfovibrionales bacterium]